MTERYAKFIILLPLVFSMAIIPFQNGLCGTDCANKDEACSHESDKDSAIPKCCSRDRITSEKLKCNVEPKEIGTCEVKEEENEEAEENE